MVKPAVENSLTEGADVAGMANICRANLARFGYIVSCALHHASGLEYVPVLRSASHTSMNSICASRVQYSAISLSIIVPISNMRRDCACGN